MATSEVHTCRLKVPAHLVSNVSRTKMLYKTTRRALHYQWYMYISIRMRSCSDSPMMRHLAHTNSQYVTSIIRQCTTLKTVCENRKGDHSNIHVCYCSYVRHYDCRTPTCTCTRMSTFSLLCHQKSTR